MDWMRKGKMSWIPATRRKSARAPANTRPGGGRAERARMFSFRISSPPSGGTNRDELDTEPVSAPALIPFRQVGRPPHTEWNQAQRRTGRHPKTEEGPGPEKEETGPDPGRRNRTGGKRESGPPERTWRNTTPFAGRIDDDVTRRADDVAPRNLPVGTNTTGRRKHCAEPTEHI